MFVVGLTGGIGSGKSTVARILSDQGIKVVNTDQVARDVVEPGSEPLERIAEHYGPRILLESGELDRAQLRKIVFGNATEKKWLENLLHPVIRRETIRALQAASGPYVILESPLLLETDQHQLVNRILVVDVPVELQLERAIQRDNNSRQQIEAIINSQISRNERLKRADDIVENSGSIDNLYHRVLQLHQSYLQNSNS